MSINQRIIGLKKSLKNRGVTLHKAIGISSGTIGNITGERQSKPSFDVIKAIVTAFPNLNSRWLITGEGGMWLDENKIEDLSKRVEAIETLLKEK